MELDFQDRENTKYTLFKVTNVNLRLGILHSNNLVNIDVKYEILEDKNMYNMIVEEGEPWQMRDYLLNAKLEGVKLFAIVE